MYLEPILTFLGQLAWPIVVVFVLVKLHEPITAFLNRTNRGSIKAGAVQIEFDNSPSALPAGISKLSQAPQTASLVQQIMSKHESIEGEELPDLSPEEAQLMTRDMFVSILVPYMEMALKRLEHKAGLREDSFNKHGLLTSDALSASISAEGIPVYGWQNIGDRLLVAQIYLDSPGAANDYDLINYIGSVAAALRLSYPADKAWTLYIGVIAGRPDSSQRVEDAQIYFAPLIRSGNLQIMLLEDSPNMNNALRGAISKVKSEVLAVSQAMQASQATSLESPVSEVPA